MWVGDCWSSLERPVPSAQLACHVPPLSTLSGSCWTLFKGPPPRQDRFEPYRNHVQPFHVCAPWNQDRFGQTETLVAAVLKLFIGARINDHFPTDAQTIVLIRVHEVPGDEPKLFAAEKRSFFNKDLHVKLASCV